MRYDSDTIRKLARAALDRAGTVRKLAADLQIAPSTVLAWQDGAPPRMEKFLELARYAGVPVEEAVRRFEAEKKSVGGFKNQRGENEDEPVEDRLDRIPNPEVRMQVEERSKLWRADALRAAREPDVPELYHAKIARNGDVDLLPDDSHLGRRKRITRSDGLEELLQILSPSAWRASEGKIIVARTERAEKGVDRVSFFRKAKTQDIEDRTHYLIRLNGSSQVHYVWIERTVIAGSPAELLAIEDAGARTADLMSLEFVSGTEIPTKRRTIVRKSRIEVIAVLLAEIPRIV